MNQSRPVSVFSRDPLSGFTLLPLSVVVFLLGLVALLATPAIRQARLEARSLAVASDLRAFSAAFQAYARERGDWPEGDSAPGALPPGMESRLRTTGWERPTPIGGFYTWAPHALQQGERYRSAIVISSSAASPVSSDRAQLTDLDRRLDDGAPDTGSLRLGFRNQPVYVLEH